MDLFDRIHLAHCAMRRAEEHLFDTERFTAEYFTARMWVKYKIMDCGNGRRYIDYE